MTPRTITPAAQGRWALVTGGSSGIGQAHAFELARRGFSVVLVGRDRLRLDATRARIVADAGVEVVTVEIDLGKAESGSRLLAALGDREIGVLVAAAGKGDPGAFVGGDLDTYLTCMNVKVRTNLELIHRVASDMQARGRGAILIVSSVGGLQGIPSLANNAATEAYLLTLGESLHHELKPHGVTVTVLMPGVTITPGFTAMVPDPSMHPRGAMTASMTAREGIAALERGRVRHIAGLQNRIMMSALSRNARSSLMGRMLGGLFASPAAARS